MKSERKPDKCNTTKIRHQSQPINTVKVFVIREAVEEYARNTNKTFPEIAKKIGWEVKPANRTRYIGDGSRLRRALGIRPENNLDPKYSKKYRKYMNISLADQILKAIDRELWEFNDFIHSKD